MYSIKCSFIFIVTAKKLKKLF